MIEIQTTIGCGGAHPMVNNVLFPLLVLAIPILLILGLSIIVFQLLLAAVRIYGEDNHAD